MANVLFLGGSKVRELNDIIGTPYVAELVLRYIDGSLERWMEEEKTLNEEYLDKLSKVDKDINDKTINALRDIFNLDAKVEVLSDQKNFEEAIKSGINEQYIVTKGTYKISNSLSLNRRVRFVGTGKDDVKIEIGLSSQKTVLDNLECMDIEIVIVKVSEEDLVAYLLSCELSAEEKMKLINDVPEEKHSQDLIKVEIDCKLELGEIDDALVLIEKVTDEGERLFYLYDVNSRVSNDGKSLLEKYLRPAVDMGNVLAIQRYVLILKDGSKAQKKEALSLLEDNSTGNAILLNIHGDFYLNGIGIKSNAKNALEKYQKARELLDDNNPEMNHSITGIANCLTVLGKQEEAMAFYSMSTDSKMVRKVVKYYKDKGDVPQVISHYVKCKNLGDVDALIDLSNYLFNQGEAYKEQSLNYAIEYVRSQDGDRKKKKAILEKQMLYYYKKEKHQTEKKVCDRIEREAADNGFRISRFMCKARDVGGKAVGTVGVSLLSALGAALGAALLKEGPFGKGGGKA